MSLKETSPSTKPRFKIGDAVIITDSALTYAGLDVTDFSGSTRVGLIVSIKNSRDAFDLDNDSNLAEVVFSTGESDWIWEEDLLSINSKT